MSKQKIPSYLKRAIWEAYGKKSAYEDIALLPSEIEIDHIIPERVLHKPIEPNEFEKWKKKYALDDDFNIQGIENLCPSTKQFNLMKGDKGFYDKAGAYDGYMRKALITAKELKSKIQEKVEKYKKESDLRRLNPKINAIEDIKQFIEDLDIDSTFLIKSLDIPINRDDLTHAEEYRNYNHILDKYRSNGISFYNYGEYLEIKDCIRYSYNNELGEKSFWMELIDEFIDNISNSLLKKKLFYEKMFAMVKARTKWTHVEVELRDYFKSLRDEKNLEVLEQAANLFNIFYGEKQRNRVKSESSTVIEIRDILLDVIDSKIQDSKTFSRITQLKFRKLMLNFGIKQEDVVEVNEEVNKNMTNRAWANRVVNEFIEFTSLIEEPQYFEYDKYYRTIKGLSEKIPLIDNHNEFDRLFERVVKIEDRYIGNQSTIKDLMKRAIRIFRSGDYSRALEQFQKIKIKAFNPDKLYDCIFAYYYIGLCFEQMDLLYASKYYYLTAFFLANENDTNYETKQLTFKCGMDKWAAINFEMGHTQEAIYSTLYSLMLRSYYSVEIIDLNNKEDVDNSNLNLLFTLIIQSYLYEKKYGSEKTLDYIINLLDNLGLLGITERSLDTLPESERDKIVDKLKKMNYKSMLDIKKGRSYSWHQLGVKWTVEWDNGANDSFISDEFISYVQIIFFCIRKMDISFLNDEVPIRLIISEELGYDGVRDGYHIVRITKNTSYNSYPHHLGRIFGVLYQIFSNCAIVSSDQFHQEMEVAFRDNYLSNSYQHLWINSFRDDNFEQVK